MQVYAIYAPAHHTPGKVQATAAEAEADKSDEPAAWSVQTKHVPDKHG
jgi:hypothetical protein